MKSDIIPEAGPEWNKVRMLEKIAMILSQIRDELQEGKLGWSITSASNAERKSESPILPKNTEYVQDA